MTSERANAYKNNNNMEFTSKFLYFSFLSVIALFSCSHVAQSVSHDSNIGFCTNFVWNRSVPLMTTVVHKQNNRMFRMFRKTDLTLRFPQVIRNFDFTSNFCCFCCNSKRSNQINVLLFFFVAFTSNKKKTQFRMVNSVHQSNVL